MERVKYQRLGRIDFIDHVTTSTVFGRVLQLLCCLTDLEVDRPVAAEVFGGRRRLLIGARSGKQEDWAFPHKPQEETLK